MAQQLFNSNIAVRQGTTAGDGKIGYDNGAYLGGIVPVQVSANTTIDWSYLGKSIVAITNANAVTVTLPVLTNSGLNGIMLPIQRDGSNPVTVAPQGGTSFTIDDDAGWVIVYADEPANKWRVFNTSGRVHLDVVDSNGINLDVSGTGSQTDPLIITPEIVLDPDAANLLTNSAAGLMVKLHATGSGVSGSGTAADPLVIDSVALARVRVVAALADRDAAFTNPGVQEGDVAKVTNGQDGLPQTFVRGPNNNWIEIEDRDSVLSVNGQTGNVVLGIAQMNDVNLAGLANGQFLSWNGVNWIPTSIPVTSYLTTQTTSPGAALTINHGLNVRTVHRAALNLATGDYEELAYRRVDDNSVNIYCNQAIQYEFRFTKGTTN